MTEQALQMVAPGGGGFYLIGVLDPTSSLNISSIEMLMHRRRIEGVYMGSTTFKRDIPLYAKLYLEGRFELDSLVSKEIALSEINEGYASLKDPNIARVVITDLSWRLNCWVPDRGRSSTDVDGCSALRCLAGL